MDKWENKIAVVTGASSGIGHAIAVKLADHGMKVAALARREDRLKELSGNYKGKGSIRGYKCDVSKESDIVETFKKIDKEMGKISVLVNNAGIALHTELCDFEIERWRQMYDVNVFGMFLCIKQLMESVKASKDTRPIHIFNINSIAGHRPPQRASALVYSTTKHAVTLLTQGLLKSLAEQKLPNIKVTSLSPGVVDTEIFDVGGWFDMNAQAIAHLKSEDIAQALVSALSLPANIVIAEMTVKPAGELL